MSGVVCGWVGWLGGVSSIYVYRWLLPNQVFG